MTARQLLTKLHASTIAYSETSTTIVGYDLATVEHITLLNG